MRQLGSSIIKKKILTDLIWNTDSKQSEIIEAAVKIIFTVKIAT